ncbi:hypothetical protein AA313_de0208341 [Arthrobotrys entomopaga]|nr:hypothetical protein AA313_de0208341 [Arthrobotrys entomopaga]
MKPGKKLTSTRKRWIQKTFHPRKPYDTIPHQIKLFLQKTSTHLRLKELSRVCRARFRSGDMSYLDSALVHIPLGMPLDAIITTYTMLATSIPKKIKYLGLDLQNLDDDEAVEIVREVWDTTGTCVMFEGRKGIERPSIVMGRFSASRGGCGWDVKLREFCKGMGVVYIPFGKLEGGVFSRLEAMIIADHSSLIFRHVSVGEGVYAVLMGIGAVLLDGCRGTKEMRGVVRVPHFLGWVTDRQAVRWGEIIQWFEAVLEGNADGITSMSVVDLKKLSSPVSDGLPPLLPSPPSFPPLAIPTCLPWRGLENDAGYEYGYGYECEDGMETAAGYDDYYEEDYSMVKSVQPDLHFDKQQQFTAPVYWNYLRNSQVHAAPEIHHHDLPYGPDQDIDTNTNIPHHDAITQVNSTDPQQIQDAVEGALDQQQEQQEESEPHKIARAKEIVEMLPNGVRMKTDKISGMVFFEYPDNDRQTEVVEAESNDLESECYQEVVEVRKYTPVGGRMGAKVYEDAICYDAWYDVLPGSWNELDLGERAKNCRSEFLESVRGEFEKKRKKEQKDRQRRKKEMARMARAEEEERLRLEKEEVEKRKREEERLKRELKQSKKQKQKQTKKTEQEETGSVKEERSGKGKEKVKEKSPFKLLKWSDEMEDEGEKVKAKPVSSPAIVKNVASKAKDGVSEAKGRMAARHQGWWEKPQVRTRAVQETLKKNFEVVTAANPVRQKKTNEGRTTPSVNTRQNHSGTVSSGNRNASNHGQTVSRTASGSQAPTSSSASSLQSYRPARTPKNESSAKLPSGRGVTSRFSDPGASPRQSKLPPKNTTAQHATGDTRKTRTGLCVIQFPDATKEPVSNPPSSQMQKSSNGYRKDEVKTTPNVMEDHEKTGVKDEKGADGNTRRAISETASEEMDESKAMEEELGSLLKNGRASFLATIGEANGVYQAVKNSLAKRKAAKKGRGAVATQTWDSNGNSGGNLGEGGSSRDTVDDGEELWFGNIKHEGSQRRKPSGGSRAIFDEWRDNTP